MTPEVYNAIIAEAHAHGMLVHAHAIALADQKAVVAPASTSSFTRSAPRSSTTSTLAI